MTVAHKPLRVAFLHPSLGFGGAERLVVNAARHLQSAGHRVTVFTASHDPRQRIEAGGDPLDIRVRGAFIPAHVWSRLEAPCSIARTAYLAACAAWSRERFDLVFCDLVPHVVPLLKRISSAKVLFYCHFPDQLLAPQRGGLYRLYRSPLERLEARGMRDADRVVVNSRFTEAMVRRTFPSDITLDVLYPAAVDEREHGSAEQEDSERVRTPIILSVNRFERKKSLDLAIEALRLLRERLPATVFCDVQLVMTGAYDGRRPEHRKVLGQLEALVQQYRLTGHVTLRPSCTEAERRAWLARCRCVIYTPSDEHFGLGPVEAMAAGRAVVGVASGGLLETVRHEETGLLCAPMAAAFADALGRLILNPEDAARMGLAGRLHVSANFSRARFGATLDAIVAELMRSGGADARGEAVHQRPSINASQSSTSASAASGAASRRAADDIAARDSESRSN